MGARHSEADQLAKRCAEAGWIVDRYSKGWKIYTDNGVVTLHTTHSDHRSILNATADLERRGLKEAETKVALMKNNVRISNIKKGRDKAEAAIREAEAKAKAQAEAEAAQAQAPGVIFSAAAEEAQRTQALAEAARANGRFTGVAEDVGIEWFAAAHTTPWMRWVNMTPEIAKFLTDHHNLENRPIRPSRVTHYKNIYLSGQWHMTHQGMASDTRGWVQDGQHRMLAMVEVGEQLDDMQLKFPVAYFVGMPIENFLAIDEGALRSAADLFARGGKETNVLALQAAVRLIAAYNDPHPRAAARRRITNENVMKIFDGDPAAYRVAAKFGATHHKKLGIVGSALSAAYYLITKKNGEDNVHVAAFFDGLLTGTKGATRYLLDEHDPRLIMRRYFDRAARDKKRLRPLDILSIIIIGWNNCITGDRPRNVRFTDDMVIPSILISKPGDGVTPAAFVGEIDF